MLHAGNTLGQWHEFRISHHYGDWRFVKRGKHVYISSNGLHPSTHRTLHCTCTLFQHQNFRKILDPKFSFYFGTNQIEVHNAEQFSVPQLFIGEFYFLYMTEDTVRKLDISLYYGNIPKSGPSSLSRRPWRVPTPSFHENATSYNANYGECNDKVVSLEKQLLLSKQGYPTTRMLITTTIVPPSRVSNLGMLTNATKATPRHLWRYWTTVSIPKSELHSINHKGLYCTHDHYIGIISNSMRRLVTKFQELMYQHA